MNNIFKILSLLGCTLLVACAIQKNGSPTGTLQGHIYNLSGNQMPGPGRPKSRGRGVVKDIYVYQATTTTQATGNMPLFTKISSRLAAHTRSDSTGRYQVKLPAGKYSVFIKETNGYFAAEADGEGHLNPVIITNGQTTTRDVTITLNAVF
ncbi:carboxypeptidase-like regulatory domain-containing protein [Mucilaginibacter lacusdianchii]|uniref:carboxypeptidase-like regulatory domain-containing protein n=1 Tax=Mucilaginibacter lacusdianchii TaxID=2684211 RepID=UPI00131D7603|nr:carboxypeptidase-like regulatory domain-containing protein [Mucilaginibacter sp. JXJ CY 39]